jgi:hypothetical protein
VRRASSVGQIWAASDRDERIIIQGACDQLVSGEAHFIVNGDSRQMHEAFGGLLRPLGQPDALEIRDHRIKIHPLATE